MYLSSERIVVSTSMHSKHRRNAITPEKAFHRDRIYTSCKQKVLGLWNALLRELIRKGVGC